ncbi:hypothetical protein [Thalassospira povalilytica]|uniref:Uncharacterized protein n=1 Tax=Thalassospira povalilytica TaxID=732237 RepID=A0ABX4R3X8_9PROT|nr:hypothetical protein [Thalassospira povalilytica]PKR47616.1 hypothetical protein CU041_18550 [Thalassospira povalilytica]
MASIAHRIRHSGDANTMIVTVITVGHAIFAMPRRMAPHTGLHHLPDTALPPLPSVDISLMGRDRADPVLRELGLGAIAALSPDDIALKRFRPD